MLLYQRDAVKQAVKTGNQRRISRCIVDRTGNHQAIRRLKERCQLILRYHQTHIFQFRRTGYRQYSPGYLYFQSVWLLPLPHYFEIHFHFPDGTDVLPLHVDFRLELITLLIWFPPFYSAIHLFQQIAFKQSVSVYIGFRCSNRLAGK